MTESAEENSRYRHVYIMYFMEDGTLGINEPKVENSGMPQGNFLKRQKVQKEDGTYLGPDDFHIGSEVTICGHTFHICGCDRFTRWFYEENGVVIEEVPRSSILAILSGAFGGLFPVPAAATSKYRYDFDFIRSTIYCIYIYICFGTTHTHTLSLCMHI